MISRREVAACLITLAGTMGAVAAVDVGKSVIGESVYEWNSLKVQKTAVGETRTIVRGPTATLDELEMHATTLNPGEASHPPHKHPNEELVLLDKGTVEALVNGEWKRLGPGSVIFNASNVMHALRNVGNAPAQYHVINWRTNKTPKQ
jgi:XRE family transcriptional regulator, regulator of sulfur utilization